jgi:hypothetical protein
MKTAAAAAAAAAAAVAAVSVFVQRDLGTHPLIPQWQGTSKFPSILLSSPSTLALLDADILCMLAMLC